MPPQTGDGADSDRSYEQITLGDLARLGRAADAELEEFFKRNPHQAAWRGRVRVVGLAQGGADHYLRGERGLCDLDVIVCFAQHPDLPERSYLRRQSVAWDWGLSKFGRCPADPAEFTGRAVDMMLWVIPDRPNPVDGLIEWLEDRNRGHPDPAGAPDLVHEPVVLIRPELGRVVWDPPHVPPPRAKAGGHRPPRGRVPT